MVDSSTCGHVSLPTRYSLLRPVVAPVANRYVGSTREDETEGQIKTVLLLETAKYDIKPEYVLVGFISWNLVCVWFASTKGEVVGTEAPESYCLIAPDCHVWYDSVQCDAISDWWALDHGTAQTRALPYNGTDAAVDLPAFWFPASSYICRLVRYYSTTPSFHSVPLICLGAETLILASIDCCVYTG